MSEYTKQEVDELLARWAKKGGSVHAGLAHGMVIHIHGEEPRQIIKPMPELIKKPRPKVIYL
jgi:hypothetical protein